MKIKIIGEYCLKFIESLILTVGILSGILSFYTGQNRILKKIEKENYIENMTHSIQEEMKNYTNQSGLENEVLKDIFLEEDVRQEIYKKIKGDNSRIQTDFLKESLRNNINKFLQQNNLSAEEESLNRFINQIASVYEAEINLYQYFGKIILGLKVAHKYTTILFGITLVLIIISLLLSKDKKCNITLFTSSFLLGFLVIYIIREIDIKHLFILHPLFSKMMQNYILEILKGMGLGSFILFCLGLCLFRTSKMKTKNKASREFKL